MSRALVVELHDVSPPFEAEVREQLRLLDAIGVRRCALLVVPNWHGEYPLAEYPSLVALLRARAAAGCEVVLHGLTHQRRGPLQGARLDRWRADRFAGDAAEFLTLSREGATEAAECGLRALREVDLPAPDTFCAPGWLLSPEGREGVRDAGLAHVTGLVTVFDTFDERRHLWPAFGYMGAGRGQERGVQAMNEVMVVAARAGGRVRTFLHPQDISRAPHARVMARLERMVRAGWTAGTYRDSWPRR